MGTVFVVVNGLCIEGQMCYYDKHEVANRLMAVVLIIFHCASILVCVFLAKRAHVIDQELNSDISVKLNQPLDWLHRRSRRSSMTSALPSVTDSSVGSASSLANRSGETETPDLLHVQTSKTGAVMTTVEISAKRFVKKHRRSKSNPTMIKTSDSQLNQLNPEGTVYSIYSDTEMGHSEEKKKKKIGLFKKVKKNQVESKNTTHPHSAPSQGRKSRKLEAPQPHSPRLYPENDDEEDILNAKPVSRTSEQILHEQQKLQEEQAKLFAEQQRLFRHQQQLFIAPGVAKEVPPPAYKSWESPEPRDTDSDGNIVHGTMS